MIQRRKLTVNDVSRHGKLRKLTLNDVSRYGKLRKLTLNDVSRYGKLRKLTVNYITRYGKLHKQTRVSEASEFKRGFRYLPPNEYCPSQPAALRVCGSLRRVCCSLADEPKILCRDRGVIAGGYCGRMLVGGISAIVCRSYALLWPV